MFGNFIPEPSDTKVRRGICKHINRIIKTERERIANLEKDLQFYDEDTWVRQRMEGDVEEAKDCIRVAEQVIAEIMGNAKGDKV